MVGGNDVDHHKMTIVDLVEEVAQLLCIVDICRQFLTSIATPT